MHEFDDCFDTNFLCVLASIVGEDGVLMAEPMRDHTTFNIGGPADVMILPRTRDEVVRVLDICLTGGVPCKIVGNGSDLLVGDRGLRGACILLRDNYSDMTVAGNRIWAAAGALLRDVALAAADAGLSGLEPLWGIPATVGGACFMNAGAYDSCTANVLESVEVYVPGAKLEDGARASGQVRTIPVAELGMGYRKSRVHDEGWIVLSATFALTPDDPDMIRRAMDEYQARREEKQPLDMSSAGSTFKRPEGYFAGKLIMDAGLRGVRVGGAQVSEKHCGFVVNADHASAADVCALIEHVQKQVKDQFGVDLEPEVRRIGEF